MDKGKYKALKTCVSVHIFMASSSPNWRISTGKTPDGGITNPNNYFTKPRHSP